MRSRKRRPAAWLASDGEKKIGSHIRSCGSYSRPEERRDVGRELVHAVAAAWARAHEHQSADELRSVDRDLLGDVSPHREAEEIDLLEAERVDERSRVPRHPGDGLRRHRRC